MKLIETRGNDGKHPLEVSFPEAILSPLSSFGGIYVPTEFPRLDLLALAEAGLGYKELANTILSEFDLGVDDSILQDALNLYDLFDDPEDPVPVIKLDDNTYVCELYHGPTRAFKDMALQPFGTVLSGIAQQRNENYLILAATSGDTGPAALETFKDQDNIRVVCLYPDGGTSDVQRLQMVTEDAANLKVVGIRGVFDDAQNALKRLLSSQEFKSILQAENTFLSAANSVNIGRIIFQMIYHVHSYLELVRRKEINPGDKVYLNVPSGNFGNALAGYYAMKMGLPVEKIVIASNSNNVLTELINNGRYDIRNRAVVTTTSPAMDILKSSNIERVLYDLYGPERTKQLMHQLDHDHCYELTRDEHLQLQQYFCADYATDQEGRDIIKQWFENGYLMDPHTATCFKAQASCANRDMPTIIYSTAEWTKFSSIIANLLTGKTDFHDIDALQYISDAAKLKVPEMISSLFKKPVAQKTIIEKEQIEDEVISFLKQSHT
jgi:threonine synthase